MRSLRSVGVALVSLLCSISVGYAQFSGSAGIGISTYQNAEGTDTAAADMALTPDLQLDYSIKLSPLSTLRPFFGLQYDLYVNKSERSNFSVYPDLTYRQYLSNHDAIIASDNTPAVLKLDSTASAISDAVSMLADSTLNLKVGVERTPLKDDALADAQNDIAATLLAYVGLLQEMGLTQSFKEVLLEELTSIKERADLLGLSAGERTQYRAAIGKTEELLKSTIALSDFALTASAAGEEHAHDTANIAGGQASIITLITTGLQHFSSSRFYTKYYLGDVLPTTYASKLTVPLSIYHKNYRSAYEAYSYTAYGIEPRLDLYPSQSIGVGIEYSFERSQFPRSPLYTFSEHALHVDSRIELTKALALVAELGLGRRTYPNPMTIVDTIQQFPRLRTRTYTATSTFTQVAPAIALVAFPGQRLALGAAFRVTRCITDSTTYFGGISGNRLSNSNYFGLASDESYIYDANTITGGFTVMLQYEIELGADVISEHRTYPPPPAIPKLRSSTSRVDDATWVTGVASKYIFFDRDILGFINSLYPRVSLTYTNLSSNLDEFSYSDLSFSAGISIGF